MPFTIKIEPEAELDIQSGIDWYNEQMPGLGVEFHAEVKAHLYTLKTNPFFQIRYDDVRCLPLKKHPYMIHFTINEEQKWVIVHAVFNTLRNPEAWTERKQ